MIQALALATDPNHDQALEQQAETAIQRGRLQEAEEIYQTLIRAGCEQPSVYGNLAALCGMGGRHAEMVPLLQKALELKPNYPEALYNLGLAYNALGDKEAAIASYQQAIEKKPDYPEAHYNLGNTMQELGNHRAAVAAYINALRYRPNHPQTNFNLGIAYKHLSDHEAAITAYQKALELRPDYPDAHYNLANTYLELGELESAVSSYSKALQIKSDHPDAHSNLGNALLELGKLEEAIDAFSHALQLKPNDPNSHTNLGHALQEKGQLEQAISAYQKALQIKPDDPSTHNHLGCALQEKGQLQAAQDAYQEALKLNPEHSDTHNNLGTVLQKQGQLEAAIAAYNTALKRKPDHPQALYNLGNALQEQGNLDGAIASYQRALQCKAKRSQVHRNLAMTLLLAGDYKKGWELYESRLDQTDQGGVLHASPQCQRWDGTSLPAGEKLLLVSEQGLGDTLQFMRYVKPLKEQGLDVSLCSDSKLHGLIQESGIDTNPLTPEQANTRSDGFWVPLLSVPKHLGVCPQNPLVTAPYIQTKPKLIEKWRTAFSKEKRPLVAINWQGNPDHETTNSKGRSLPLELFSPLAQRCDVTLLSLQKGWGSEQLETCSFRDRFSSAQPQVSEAWDFLETAAILANCDLVITSDTSLAHLAGGMGKPTWLLLKKVPEWRWGLAAEESFWYPTMRLFRQRQRGDWAEVLERVADALQELCQHPSSPALQIPSSPAIQIAVSLGELIDKLCILEIKMEHLQGDARKMARKNVEKERQELREVFDSLGVRIDPRLITRLKEVNADLWRIEDEIRAMERNKDFGETFIRLARSVYLQNDRRAAIKREINSTYGSALMEEKLYEAY